MQSGERDRGEAARQAALLDHLGDGADVRVLAVVANEDENALGVADFGRDRGGHPGEEDAVVKWNQQQLHMVSPIWKVEDLSF